MIKLATLFSGVGAIEEAFIKQKIEYKIVFAADNGEREIKSTAEEIREQTKGMSLQEKNKYIEELNDILRFADIFASSSESKYKNYANRIVSNLQDFYCNNDMFNSYAVSIFTKMGLFPSIEILNKSKREMSEVLLDYLNNENKTEDEEILNLIKVVKETVHEKYYLVKALEHGIAYHYGQMPKAIREKIEDLFRRKVIKLIFTTSTLLEGVNIQAKNIILTSDNNGLSDLTEEDFLNLIGRAGRFRSELYGNVICLKGAFEKSQRYKYFSSQNVSNLSSEVLSAIRGNFYKDIKQIIQGRQPITKNLEEEHKKKLIREQYANIAILHNKMNYNSKLKTNLIRATSDPNVWSR